MLYHYIFHILIISRLNLQAVLENNWYKYRKQHFKHSNWQKLY